MTAKEWLMRAWKIDREINTLLEAQKSAYDRLTSITAAGDNTPVPGTKGQHRFDSYTELSDKIDRRIDELHAIKAEVMDVISLVENNTQRALLINRYVQYKAWEQIAVDINYSYRGIMKIHSAALQSVSAILEAR